MLARSLTLAFVVLLLSAPCALAQSDAKRPHPARGLELETIAWIDDGAEFLDHKPFKTRLTGSEKWVDREAILEEALGRARRLKRPVLWYIPKISETGKRGRQMIRAPLLDLAMRQVIWCDEDIERIVGNSFVPVRMVCDEKLAKRIGRRPPEVLEPAVLFFGPDGKMIHLVHSIRTLDAAWFAEVLRQVLEKAHGSFEGDLNAALDRGEWAHASRILEAKRRPGLADLYERAKLRRRMQDGKGALQRLDDAEAHLGALVKAMAAKLPQRARRRFQRSIDRGRPPRGNPEAARLIEIAADMKVERGVTLLRMGKSEAAKDPLRDAAHARAGTRRDEAAYLLAMMTLHSGDEAGAMKRFMSLAQKPAPTRHTRKAKVNVTAGRDDHLPMGAAPSGLERLTWLPEGTVPELPEDTRWRASPIETKKVIERSLAFLLQQQRADGGWKDSRYAYCPDSRITPNVWMAVSALCCQALLRHQERAGSLRPLIREAIKRGERYLSRTPDRGCNEDVYADAYRLFYLAHRQPQDFSRTEPDLRSGAWHGHRSKILTEAASRQSKDGFWAHEYPNAFCTGVMVQAMMADHAGTRLPDMLERAKRALLSARFSDGSFSYSGTARGKPRKDGLKNASTRMPLCESALLALGASDQDKLANAFQVFWKHYDRIKGVQRTDFHTDGEIAGFMYFHTMYHTSEAAKLLPSGEREAQLTKLAQCVLETVEMDGTFMDSHEVGRSYGTAMALLVLANAADPVR